MMNHFGKNAYHTLVEQHIETGKGDLPALLQLHRTAVTYAELAMRVNQVSAFLIGIGITRGDRVTLLLPDSYEWVYGFLACLKIGAVAVPLNTFSKPVLVEKLVDDSQAKVLLYSTDYRETVTALDTTLRPYLKNTVIFEHACWENLVEIPATVPVNTDDIAFYLYTSGSTGEPKAAIHTHGNICHCISAYGAKILEIAVTDRCFSTSKLFFAYGLGNSLLFPLAVGASCVLNPEVINTPTLTALLEQFSPTLFFSVPAFYSRLLHDPAFNRAHLASVRMCVSAGENLPKMIAEQWQQHTGKIIYDGIGCTETLHIFCSNRSDAYCPGSSGLPVPGYELKIVDDHYHRVKPGEIGSLLVRGGSLAKGYWNNLPATQKMFYEDWLISGDLYHQNQDGFYFFDGRRDDGFKSNGLWVSPVEVEQALLTHESVQEAAVVASSNAEGLTIPKAYVVLKENKSFDTTLIPQTLIAYLENKLSKYKTPQDVVIVATLPRTATGKVARGELRKQVPLKIQEISPPIPKSIDTGHLIPIRDGIFLLRLPLPFRLDHINVYILEDTQGWIIVDCGLDTPESRTIWENVLPELLAKKQVIKIIVTHYHPDHIGLAHWLKQLTAAPVFMVHEEWKMAHAMWRLYHHGTTLIQQHYQRLGLPEHMINALIADGGYRNRVPHLPERVLKIRHGENVVSPHNPWRVLTGSGHSPAHACLWQAHTQTLLAGDHILDGITPHIGLFPVGLTNPVKNYLESLKRFAKLPCQLVLPSHKLPFSTYKNRIEELHTHHQTILLKLKDFCRTPRSAYDCVEYLYRPDLPLAQLNFAVTEAAAHLEYLKNTGILARIDSGNVWKFKVFIKKNTGLKRFLEAPLLTNDT